MKKTLNELSSLARIIENCFSGLSPTDIFQSQFSLGSPIYKNYNYDLVGFPSDIKKPFGYKRILESFARSLGYNTYNGLVESGTPDHDLKDNALEYLNPFPISEFYSDLWRVVSNAIMRDLLKDENFSEHVALGFKRDKAIVKDLSNGFGLTQLLKGQYEADYSDLTFSPKLNNINHFYGVATSFYSHALNIGSDREGSILIENIPLKEFVTFSEWDGSNFSKFKNKLIQMMNRLFKVELRIKGRNSNPLDREVTILLKSEYIAGDDEEGHIQVANRNTLLNNQLALKTIAAELKNDPQYYRLDETKNYILTARPLFSPYFNNYFDTQTVDVEFKDFMNGLVDIESMSKIGCQPKYSQVFSGTKLYMLNLMPYGYPFKDERYGTVASVEDILDYWKNRVLPNLIPCDRVEAS